MAVGDPRVHNRRTRVWLKLSKEPIFLCSERKPQDKTERHGILLQPGLETRLNLVRNASLPFQEQNGVRPCSHQKNKHCTADPLTDKCQERKKKTHMDVRRDLSWSLEQCSRLCQVKVVFCCSILIIRYHPFSISLSLFNHSTRR